MINNKNRKKGNSSIAQSRGNDRRFAAVTAGIIIILLAVRLFRFGAVPGGMNQDGAMAAVDAKALAEYGTDRLGMKYPVHLTAWGFGQMSAMLSYLAAPFIKLFGLSVLSARIPSLFASLAGAAAAAYFVKTAFGREAGAMALFITAVNPWHVIQSRWVIDCNLFPHFLMTGMLFLILGCRSNRRKRTVLYCASMVFFGLSMFCYGIAIYTVPVFLVFAGVYLMCAKRLSPIQGIVCFAVYLLISWPFILCMIINFFGLPTIETPLFTIPYFPDTIRTGDIIFFSEKPLSQLWINLRCTLGILFQKYSGPLCNEVKGFGTMYGISVPFMFIGAVSLLRRFRKNPGAALTWLMFLTGMMDGLITANVNINRINLIFYPMIVFCSMGIMKTAELVNRLLSDGRVSFIHSLRGIPAGIYLIAFAMFTRSYFTEYADEISRVFMEDFGTAMVSVRDAAPGKYVITPDAQYKGFWYVSEALTLFYHDTDAEFYQSEEFRKKYQFRNPSPGKDPDTDTVYVVNSEDAGYFPENEFEVTVFGRFCTAVPRGDGEE